MYARIVQSWWIFLLTQRLATVKASLKRYKNWAQSTTLTSKHSPTKKKSIAPTILNLIIYCGIQTCKFSLNLVCVIVSVLFLKSVTYICFLSEWIFHWCTLWPFRTGRACRVGRARNFSLRQKQWRKVRTDAGTKEMRMDGETTMREARD